MRNYLFQLCGVFFIVFNLQANQITGFVVDRDSREPLENVNVYVANTTFGSSTDRDGYFIIKSVPAGIQEIIISIVGYELKSHTLLVKDSANYELIFRLKPIIYETETTQVFAEFPDEWLRDLEQFKRLFIGQSEFAENCEIQNPEVLDFTWTAAGIMRASAQKPLIIINNSLGYHIHCVLVNFYWNKSRKKCTWLIKSEFTDLESENSMQSSVWRSKRNQAYYGSLVHFLHSLINRKLIKNKYITYFVDGPGDRNKQAELLQTTIDYDHVLKQSPIKSEHSIDFLRYMCVVHNSFEVSWIKLTGVSVLIDSWGQPQSPNPFDMYGKWAEKGIADQLPMYYDPLESH